MSFSHLLSFRSLIFSRSCFSVVARKDIFVTVEMHITLRRLLRWVTSLWVLKFIKKRRNKFIISDFISKKRLNSWDIQRDNFKKRYFKRRFLFSEPDCFRAFNGIFGRDVQRQFVISFFSFLPELLEYQAAPFASAHQHHDPWWSTQFVAPNFQWKESLHLIFPNS